jgi:hypothetical protein
LPVFRDDFERALLDLHLQPQPKPERSAVRRAYAQLAKTIRPDDDPNGFQSLRQSYETALIGIDDGFYDDYEDYEESNESYDEPKEEQEKLPSDDESQTIVQLDKIVLTDADGLQQKARPFQTFEPITQTTVLALGELEQTQQNDQNEIQKLRDQINAWLAQPEEQEDTLLRLTDQLLAHRAMEWLEVSFETRNWLLSQAAWNENAPLNWLQQLNAHFDLEKTQDDYNQSLNYSDAAIQKIMARLNAVDQWASIRLTAATDSKSAASFVLNANSFFPWLWIRTFWQSFDPVFRTSVNNLLGWIATTGQSAARNQPTVTAQFRRRWNLAQQFSAIGKVKTCLLVLLCSSLFSAYIESEKEASFPAMLVSLFAGFLIAGAFLWLGGAALDKLRERLANYYVTLTKLELLTTFLLLCLLPLVTTAGLSVATDYEGYAFLAIAHPGWIPTMIVIVFFVLFLIKTAIDTITYQYTLFLQAKGEMLFGLGLLYAIVAWLTSLSSGFNFSISTAVVGFYLFMATLATSAIQRAGPNFFTWRGGSALKIKPQQTIIALIILLTLHMVATQLLTPAIIPNQTRELTSPISYYLLATSTLLLGYLTILACGLPVSGNQGFIIFTFIAISGGWAFIANVKDTMPLVRFQIADLFLIINLFYSLYITHKSQKETAQ